LALTPGSRIGPYQLASRIGVERESGVAYLNIVQNWVEALKARVLDRK
jgi:hypothetical protein